MYNIIALNSSENYGRNIKLFINLSKKKKYSYLVRCNTFLFIFVFCDHMLFNLSSPYPMYYKCKLTKNLSDHFRFNKYFLKATSISKKKKIFIHSPKSK